MRRHAASSNGRLTTKAVAVAEAILGKKLPNGVVVHHMNGDFSNDAPDNLAVFPSKAYHNLIHARMAAFFATGDPNKLWCDICKTYDDPENLYTRTKYGLQSQHRACHAKRELARWRKKNGK